MNGWKVNPFDPRAIMDLLKGLGGSGTGPVKSGQYGANLAGLQAGRAPQPTAAPPAAPAPTAPAPTGDLWSQYQEKLAPITQQSEQLLKDYYALSAQGPTFAQKLLDSIKQAGQWPSQATMREEYAQNPNLTPMAIEGLVSRRGQSTRGTIQDIITRATGGFEADIESRRGAAEFAQTRRANILEEYGLEYKSEQDALDRIKAGRGSDAKRARDSAKQQAELDASRGATSEQLARAYGSVLEPWEILQVYNDKGLYGPIEDLTGQFYKWLPEYGDETNLDQQAIMAYVSAIESGEITISQVPSSYKSEVMKRTGQSETETESPGFLGRLLGR